MKIGKLNYKVTIFTAVLLSISFTSAFASVPDGTVAIGNKAYDLNYANAKENEEEIINEVIKGNPIYIKGFDGIWTDNLTGKNIDKSAVPSVTYKNANGTVSDCTDRDSDASDKSIAYEPLTKTVNYYKTAKQGKVTSWWQIVGVEASGENINGGTWNLPEWQGSDIEGSVQSADYAGYILGLIARGENPSQVFNGRNLLSELQSKQNKDDGSFGTINSHIWAMIALDKAKGKYDEDKAAAHLLKQQKNDGGYAYGEDNTSDAKGDPDMTGMALIALSNHTDVPGVKEAINKSIGFLKSIQNSSAGFSSWDSDNSNSTAMVISGLVACGQDIMSDTWKKDGKTMLDALLRFQMEDGSFTYTLDNKKSNSISTYESLIALDDLKNNKSTWK